jgi:dTDP-4-amino-4,6-dideoxygalactose transaminase
VTTTDNRIIAFFNYCALFAEEEEEIMQTIRRVLAGGRFILQEELEQFERRLADFVGVRYAFGVGNGTDGLLLALRASGIEQGAEVIIPAHTFVATGSAVHHAGGVPVLADCGADHLVDPESVRSKITSRTKAIVPVHLNGRTCAMDQLGAIADEHGLLIVEDAAQGLGSAFDGQRAGGFGCAAMFSFYPAKTLGCFGDGGAVVTSDDGIAAHIRTLRNHGRTPDGDVREWSLNSRLDNVQAAILDLKLKSYEQSIERRREIARMYDNRLSGIAGLQLPPSPDSNPRHFDVYQNYEIEAVERDGLREHLLGHGVDTILQWGGRALHHFPRLGFDAHLPMADRITERSLLLPMNLSLTDDDICYVCDLIADYHCE